ncbi:YgjV family protein [Azospirillum rugosum]|uniref:Inner membrane protein n=1 Tax=Azospirillum rugosum TaxID=416170 RepID=A0ABS4SQ78_9PROT|nr:YgjV family protein [Azospirillum rugosum]MBP2294706.1 hypothetical protein [Azospirillum rugosum]MDQ0528005.1 hypothetical protein [Azospirillum rugosum]
MLPLSASDLAGFVGLALVAVWPLLKGRRALLAGQSASTGAFLVHYLLAGSVTAAAMCGLSIVQAGAAWSDDRSWWRKALFVATLPALALLASLTWAGPASAWSAAGLALATVARWQVRPDRLRLLFLLAAAAWIVHDVLTGSVPGLLADLLCAASLAYGWARGAGRAAPAGGVA